MRSGVVVLLALAVAVPIILGDSCDVEVNGRPAIKVFDHQETRHIHQAVYDPQVETFHVKFTLAITNPQENGDQFFTLEFLDPYLETTPPYDGKNCNINDSPVCKLTYDITASDFSESSYPDTVSTTRGVKITSSYGTVCRVDIEERKAGVGIELSSHWRDDGDYYSLITNITRGFPMPITISNLQCNQRQMNYTLVNKQEFRVPKSLYVGQTLSMCTIVATNGIEDVTKDIPPFPTVPATTTASTMGPSEDSPNTSNSTIVGLIAALVVAGLVVIIAVPILIVCKFYPKWVKADRARLHSDTESQIQRTSIKIINGDGRLDSGHSLSDISVNAPSETAECANSLDSQYSTGSSDLEQDGSHDRPQDIHHNSQQIIPEHPDNNISKDYVIPSLDVVSDSQPSNTQSVVVVPLTYPSQVCDITQPTDDTATSGDAARVMTQVSADEDDEKQVGDLTEREDERQSLNHL